jgi:hypothetical protein
MEGPCLVCGSQKNIQIHNVKKLSKMNPKLKGFNKLMSISKRKQIPVCVDCHRNIHSGQYDQESFNRLLEQKENKGL